ncbi:hypothetical protein ACKWTF_014149 [Chironomus riparius]
MVSFVIQQKIISKFSCQFVQQNYRSFNNIHTCKVREDLNVHHKNVELEIGSHEIYVNIPGFSIMNKIIFYLPKGIVKFFPNLEMLEVIQSGLKEISSTDLEPFRILKYLDLSGNNIATLEGKLFQFNSKLEVLLLNDNEISTVDQLTFYGLYNLKFLGIQRNHCFSEMTKDASAVQNMINVIKFSCSKDNNQQSINLENIKKELTKSNAEMSILKNKLFAVVEENRNIRTTFDAHNKAVENLRTQLFGRQKRIEDKLEKQDKSLDNKINPNLLNEIQNLNFTFYEEFNKIEQKCASKTLQHFEHDAAMSVIKMNRNLFILMIVLSLITYLCSITLMRYAFKKISQHEEVKAEKVELPDLYVEVQ